MLLLLSLHSHYNYYFITTTKHALTSWRVLYTTTKEGFIYHFFIQTCPYFLESFIYHFFIYFLESFIHYNQMWPYFLESFIYHFFIMDSWGEFYILQPNVPLLLESFIYHFFILDWWDHYHYHSETITKKYLYFLESFILF